MHLMCFMRIWEEMSDNGMHLHKRHVYITYGVCASAKRPRCWTTTCTFCQGLRSKVKKRQSTAHTISQRVEASDVAFAYQASYIR